VVVPVVVWAQVRRVRVVLGLWVRDHKELRSRRENGLAFRNRISSRSRNRIACTTLTGLRIKPDYAIKTAISTGLRIKPDYAIKTAISTGLRIKPDYAIKTAISTGFMTQTKIKSGCAIGMR